MTTRRLLQAFLIVASASAFMSRPVRAGAWTVRPGHSYLRETIAFYRAAEYFDENGARQPGDWFDPSTTFTNTQFLHIGEYGLREGTSITTELRYKDIRATRSDRPDAAVSGFGDLKLGLKKRLVERPFVVSLLGQLEIPTGYETQIPPSGDDRGDFYTLGSGAFNLEVRVLLGGGYRLAWMPGYYTVESGYRFRGGPYANDATYAGAVGISPLKRLWLRAGMSGVENLRTADEVAALTDDQVYNSASYTSVGLAAAVVLTRALSIELSYGGELRGANTFRGRAVEIGMEIRR